MKRLLAIPILGLSPLAAQQPVPPQVATNAPALANASLACDLSFNQGVFTANTNNTAVMQVLVCTPPPGAAERQNINLCLLVDASGSMQGPKLEQAKRAARDAVERLEPRDRFAMIVLGRTVDTVVPSRAVSDRAEILRRIDAIAAGGTTSLFTGLSRAAAELRKHLKEEFTHRIILISDGDANEGPSSVRLLGRLSRSFGKENISLSTIGVGEGFNEDLMTQLAEHSDGNFYYAESATQLPVIIQAELRDLNNVVASDVRLSIDCINGVQANRILGRAGYIEDNRVDFYLNQLVAGQNERLLVEVDLPPNAPGARLEPARAQMRFRNGNTKESDQVEASAEIGFSDDSGQVESSVNPPVQKAAVLTEAAVAQEQALWYFNAGETNKASQLLNLNKDNLWREGQNMKDDELVQQSSQAGQVNHDLQRRVLTPQQQKQLRNDSFNTRRGSTKQSY